MKEILEDYIEICSELASDTNLLFNDEYIEKITKKSIALYKEFDEDITDVTSKFLDRIRKIFKDYRKNYEKHMWNCSDRIYDYMKEGLIESGTIISQLEFETQEIINSEIFYYKRNNEIEKNYVEDHIKNVCEIYRNNKKKNRSIISPTNNNFFINNGQMNFANENGRVDAVQNKRINQL